jgi:hypothetical protein
MEMIAGEKDTEKDILLNSRRTVERCAASKLFAAV